MSKILRYISASFLILLCITISASATSPTTHRYQFDKSHTNIMWFANHFGYSDSMGQFMDYDGYVIFDADAPETSEVDITIQTNSIMTGIEKFDNHLKSKDFFDVIQHPTAHFRSKKITLTGKNTANVEGNFTMLGITKPLTLTVTFNKQGMNPYNKKQTIGFTATSIINRLEYGMNYGAPGIGTDIKIHIETELLQ